MNAEKFNELFYDELYKNAHKNLWCDPTHCLECLKEASICDSNFIDQETNSNHMALSPTDK